MRIFQAQLTGQRAGVQKFSQYYPSSMLPPPPPAPMARPVAIIRSTGELSATNSGSPPTSSTSPHDPSDLNGTSQDQQMAAAAAAAAAVGLVGTNCQSGIETGRKSPTRILVTAPHTSREYTFAHFHSQPGQVSDLMKHRKKKKRKNTTNKITIYFQFNLLYFSFIQTLFIFYYTFVIYRSINYFIYTANIYLPHYQFDVRSDFTDEPFPLFVAGVCHEASRYPEISYECATTLEHRAVYQSRGRLQYDRADYCWHAR